jgi:hypothetical protein
VGKIMLEIKPFAEAICPRLERKFRARKIIDLIAQDQTSQAIVFWGH